MKLDRNFIKIERLRDIFKWLSIGWWDLDGNIGFMISNLVFFLRFIGIVVKFFVRICNWEEIKLFF